MMSEIKQVAQLFGTKVEPNPSGGKVYSVDGLMRTLGEGHGMSQPYILEPSGIYTDCTPDFQRGPLPGLSRILKAVRHDSGVVLGGRIRKLTPLECFRLMGFSDEDFYKAKYFEREEAIALLAKYPEHFNKKQHRQFTMEQRIERISDSQLYKQAGNSIIVNVLEAIFGQMMGE